jgi:hypothetical protein
MGSRMGASLLVHHDAEDDNLGGRRCWPRKSELCLPWLLASRALGARRWPTGFRPGFWQQGQ